MTDKDFDKIFRDRLGEYSEPVDGAVWAAIEGSLSTMAPVTKPQKNRKFIYYISSVAAVLLIAFIALKPDGKSDISRTEQQIAVVEKSPEVEEGVVEENIEVDFGEKQIAESGNNRTNVTETSNIFTDNEVQEKQASTSEAVVTDSNAANDAKSNVSINKEQSKEKQTPTTVSDGYTNWSLIEKEDSMKKHRKGYSVSLFSNMVSPNGLSGTDAYNGSMAASGLSHSNSYMQSMEIVSEPRYSLPVNLGVQAQVRLNSYISLGLGVGYTWLGSKYDALVNKKAYSVKQHLHYIGIPVNLYFTLLNNNNLYLYANVGGAIEKGLKAKYELTSYDGSILNEDASIKGFQYSVNAGIGLEYRFINYFGIYLEPNVAYYFDSDIPASIRTEQPLQIKGEIGLRFHIR